MPVPTEVTINCGGTVALKDYENIKVSVTVTFDGDDYAGDSDACHDYTKEQLEKSLNTASVALFGDRM